MAGRERTVVGETNDRPGRGGAPGHHLRPPRIRHVRQAAFGYDYDTLAADLHQLITKLDLRDVTLAGFSMGGGEVARYLGKYGSERVKKAAFIAAIPPFLLKTPDNRLGVDGEVFEGIKKALAADRVGFLAVPREFLQRGRLGRQAHQRPGCAIQLEHCVRRLAQGHAGLRLGVADGFPERPRRHQRARAGGARRCRPDCSARRLGQAHA